MFPIRTLAALALSASAAVAPSLAQSVGEHIRVTVSYADLDIGHAPGAQILLRRLDAAAVKACGGAPDIRLLTERAAFDKCRRMALDEAVVQVNAPALTAAAARTGLPILVARR